MSPPSLKWGWWYSQPSRRSQVPASNVAQSQPAFVSQSFWHCSDEAWYGALSEVPSPCFKLWNSTKTFASARPRQRAAKRAHGASGRPAMLSTRLIHRSGRDCWALCWALSRWLRKQPSTNQNHQRCSHWRVHHENPPWLEIPTPLPKSVSQKRPKVPATRSFGSKKTAFCFAAASSNQPFNLTLQL